MPTLKSNRNGETKKDFRKLFKWGGCEFASDETETRALECPFCGKAKFYVNTETGQFKCHSANTCGAGGNAYNLIRRFYAMYLEATTDEDYRRLKSKRDTPLQTLKRHGLAWNSTHECWLIPSMSKKGEVQNLLQYNPETGSKYSLPDLPLRLFGLDRLRTDPNRTLILCEGAWDAIALDHHFRDKKTHNRFDVLAVPSATVFNPEWLEYLKGRTVRLCFDNDKAGEDGQQRIAKMVRDEKIDCKLFALEWPSGADEGCDISDLIRDGESIADFTHENCKRAGAGERRIIFQRGDQIKAQPVEWLWDGHIAFNTLVSLSGRMGTQKSTVVKDVVARGTAGRPMPNCKTALAPFDVFYFTSEDSAAQVQDIVRIHKGDLDRLHIYDTATASGDPIDLLDCLEEVEAQIKEFQCRLVVIDALNSFVGGDISTDSKARRSLSGRLQTLARRTGASVIGIRNWGRADGGSASQKALGATSLSDVARCVMNTRELRPWIKGKQSQRCLLEFEKVSDAPKPLSIPYTVESLSTNKAESHFRRIVWEKARFSATDEQTKKGSAKR